MPGASEVSMEARALYREARPLVITNLGNMALGLVDVAVVGRLGAQQIAAAGLGNAIFFNVALFGAGVMFALDPLIAQALGARERPVAARTALSGLWLAVLLTPPIALVTMLVTWLVPPLSVDAATAADTRAFVWSRLSALLPFLLTLACRGYLQAHGRPRALVAGVIAANLVNLPVAIVLVHGTSVIGLPSTFEGWGLTGAGIATGIASIVQLVVTASRLPRMLTYDLGRPPSRHDVDPSRIAAILRLGTPLGLQIVLEAGSFWAVTVVIGTFGTVALAAHHIALTAVSTTFQVALGIGGATAVRVGRAIGEGSIGAGDAVPDLEPSRIAARRAGLLGIGAGALAMALGALLFAVWPGELGAAMTTDVAVVRAAIPLFLVAACFQLSDGTQTVAQGALRGAGDTSWPLACNFGGHYLIGIPVGLYLALVLGWGPVGLWWGLSAGLTAAAVLLVVRFDRISRRTMRRA